MELWLTRIKVVPNLNVDLGENEPSITEWQTPEGINLLDLSATPPTDSCYECDFHYLMLFLIRLLQGVLNNERNWRQINLRNFLFIMRHFESSEVRYLTQVIALHRKNVFSQLNFSRSQTECIRTVALHHGQGWQWTQWDRNEPDQFKRWVVG